MAKRPARKKTPPVGGGGEHTGDSKPSRSQPNANKQSSYAHSRQLLKDLEESPLGLMIRNARWEFEKAIYNFRENLKKHIEENRVTSEQLPAALVKYNSSFPLLFRRHTKANKDAMQALETMGFGEKSWIHTAPGKKYGVDSELNRYLVRVIPHLQRFCEIGLQSPQQHLPLAVPRLDHCRNAQQAQEAFDNAIEIFRETGKPLRKTSMEWAKRVFTPLIEAGYGDPYDIPSVPEIPATKLVGAGGSDKSSRSPRERLVHYVFMALKGMLKDRQNDTKQVN